MTDSGSILPFADESAGAPAVRGFLHTPAASAENGIVLTHGAGSNCNAPMLLAIAAALAEIGFMVLRCDLPFRQARRTGPPSSGSAGHDREGLRHAVAALRKVAAGKVYLGGHSYGGRQATMLAAGEPKITDGLLLLSYPLHPPRRPAELRTAHFPNLRTAALFVHGSRDPFGTLAEMRSALSLIPAVTEILEIEGGGHDLSLKSANVASLVAAEFLKFVSAL
jgi:uncharacterized protein